MSNRRNFLAYSLLFLGSCTFVKTTKHQSDIGGNRPDKLRFAVTDINGLDELEQDFGAFRQALAELLEIPIEFYPVENYSAAAPALLANELDLAFAGPSEYLILRARAEAVPLVGITRPGYYSVIMARTNSGIETLAELKGKTIAMRTEGSTAGHIVPTKLLMDAGLSAKGDFDVVMLDLDSLPALLNGEVDAWADSSTRYVELVQNQGLANTEIKVLAQGENLPPDVFMANPGLDKGFIEELRSKILNNKDSLMAALLASEANQKYRESRIIAAQDIDYQTLRDMYYAIGQASAIE
ncbi:MAG: phosphate/phosphite/phosphonate ABC transporter substrate-binding protein [Cyanobacteria bacterium J06639_16]